MSESESRFRLPKWDQEVVIYRRGYWVKGRVARVGRKLAHVQYVNRSGSKVYAEVPFRDLEPPETFCDDPIIGLTKKPVSQRA